MGHRNEVCLPCRERGEPSNGDAEYEKNNFVVHHMDHLKNIVIRQKGRYGRQKIYRLKNEKTRFPASNHIIFCESTEALDDAKIRCTHQAEAFHTIISNKHIVVAIQH